MAYHYRCADCYCALYLEEVEEGEPVYSAVTGELCSSCEAEQDNDDDDGD